MEFLDQLRAFLESPRHIQTRKAAPDNLAARASTRLYELLERGEKSWVPGVLRMMHHVWTGPGKLARFTGHAWAEVQGIAKSDQEAQRLVLLCLEQAVGMEARESCSQLERMEIGRVVDLCLKATTGPTSLEVEAYAVEVGLWRPGAATTTGAGDVFRDLVGTDAVKWLLHLEALRSTGPNDPWRTHRQVMLHVLRHPQLYRPEGDWYDPEDDGAFVPPETNIIRLCDLGVVEQMIDPGDPLVYVGWSLTDSGSQILEQVLAQPVTPMHALAVAALADDLGSIVGPSSTGGGASKATVEFSAIIAHELRNALGPMRSALTRLFDPTTDPEHQANLGNDQITVQS